ncbi:uncharacterized protein BYT42DRAFT_615900 [Radiomyces spectabilis]|uniref:uncharacterized protein n=1 Tax=Radiomyces spectabilis TaxID=64574 RepID=UPI00221EF822|nr:uncharacterized protein BYT42DRAFT_615900 [Radiomyces spectabilis]KAI8372686.1 hypothetical protein BYT42DRAFT_615900 [Radiomyces spectabilis]
MTYETRYIYYKKTSQAFVESGHMESDEEMGEADDNEIPVEPTADDTIHQSTVDELLSAAEAAVAGDFHDDVVDDL